jgi:hypothetical protein
MMEIYDLARAEADYLTAKATRANAAANWKNAAANWKNAASRANALYALYVQADRKYKSAEAAHAISTAAGITAAKDAEAQNEKP